MTSKQQDILEDWVLNLQPNSLGPLLMALTSNPRSFSAPQHGIDISSDMSLSYQQQAIVRCLNWISTKINACQQFEETVIRMNRDGVKPPSAGQAYCENRLRMDSFMERTGDPEDIEQKNRRLISSYKKLTNQLGKRINPFCEYKKEYYGPYFAPASRLKTYYKGPSID
jgi:hypothetical protein